MKSSRRILTYIIYLLLGIILWGLAFVEVVDTFWAGMGASFFLVGLLRLAREYRFNKDEDYREKVETEIADERNHFLRNKAWAWAGYLFILISASAVIILKIMGQELLSTAAGFAVCLMLVLYWGSFAVLKRKY